MKKKVKYGIKAVLFAICICVIVGILNRIFIPKWTSAYDNHITQIVDGFYSEPKDSIDIIFLGNSDLYRGISPVYLFEQYGYSSYVRATPGQKLWVSYYVLLETLNYQTPSLIIMDMDSLYEDEHSGEGNYRKTIDTMRMSYLKWQLIHDPVFEFDFDTRMSYLFPLIRYHSRWNELTEEDFTYYFQKDRWHTYHGMDFCLSQNGWEYGYDYMTDTGETIEISERCQYYMDRIVEICQEREIPLLLIEVPSAISWSSAKSNRTMAYAEEHGLEFLDLNLIGPEIGFDWMTDTSDFGDHLNVGGAEKITEYLGSYVKRYYEITDHRGEEAYARWEESIIQYEEEKNGTGE